jgi:hypothetical protein
MLELVMVSTVQLPPAFAQKPGNDFPGVGLVTHRQSCNPADVHGQSWIRIIMHALRRSSRSLAALAAVQH